jgi:sugar lactone lactonase YvrE
MVTNVKLMNCKMFNLKWILASLIAVLFFAGVNNSIEARQSLEDVYAEAIQLFENKNYSGYLKKMELANRMRPNHRVIMYRLASAYALNDRLELAEETLLDRIDYYAVDDFSNDSVFTKTFDTKQLAGLKAKVDSLNMEISFSEPHFQIDRKGFHGEGIVFSEYLDKFLISDARCGEILSVDLINTEHNLIADLKKHGFWGAFGMVQDSEDNRYIWIATSALFNYCETGDETKDKAAIIKYDLKEAEVVFSYFPEGNHTFGDVTIGPDGHIYFTDSADPKVYKLDRNSMEVSTIFSGKDYWNLQGVAVTTDFIFVADYISGIYQYDRSTKEITQLSRNNQVLRGSDGIYYSEEGLLILQNGTFPKKVRFVALTSDGLENEKKSKIIDSVRDGLNEPTLGTIHNDRFYFIFNSPWGFYSDEGNPDLESWPVLHVHSISLN